MLVDLAKKNIKNIKKMLTKIKEKEYWNLILKMYFKPTPYSSPSPPNCTFKKTIQNFLQIYRTGAFGSTTLVLVI